MNNLKSNTHVETDDRQTYTNAFIKTLQKKGRLIISITKQLGLGLLVRGLQMWISYSLWISWISIFSQRRILVDFVDFDF